MKTPEASGNSPPDLSAEMAFQLMLADLIPSVLHEINNSLTSLSVYANLLNRDAIVQGEDFAELRQEIQSNTDSMMKLTSDSSALFRLQDARELVDFGPIFDLLLRYVRVKFRREQIVVQQTVSIIPRKVQLSQRKLALLIYCAFENMYLLLRSNASEAGQRLLNIRSLDHERSQLSLLFSPQISTAKAKLLLADASPLMADLPEVQSNKGYLGIATQVAALASELQVGVQWMPGEAGLADLHLSIALAT